MEKRYSNIDDLFRDKFKDFELYPPDHIWDNIKQQIKVTGKDKSGKGLSNGSIIGITIILVISSIVAFYLLQTNTGYTFKNEKNEIRQSTGTIYNNSTPRSATLTSQDINKTLPDNNSSDPKALKAKNRQKLSEKPASNIDSNIPKGKANLTVSSSAGDINVYSGVKTSQEITNPGFTTGSPSAGNFSSGEADIAGTPESPAPGPAYNYNDESDKIIEESAVTDSPEELSSGMPTVPADIRSDYGKKGSWLFGLYFTPEVIFNPAVTGFNNRSYSLDLNAIYQFSEFIVQSGFGFGWSSDNGNYKIDYNQYLGSYDDVYDVTFDTIGGQLIPIYHTESVNVYDTLDHVTISPTKRHFTYLNIPLLFGYRNEGKRWGWNVKAGPSLSFLIKEDIPDINLTDSQNKILNVEDEIPGRLKTNWQFLISAGLSYKLSNTISLAVEPLFKYYVNPIHDQNGTKTGNPYSFGLRAGFVLGF